MAGHADLLDHRVRPAAGEPEGALVLLHGRGADEHDLFGLLDELDPERRLVGLTPRAPLALPPGGAHWYVVREVGFPDPETFRASLDLLTRWFDALCERTGVGPERTVLGGFSQGTVMSYALGLGPGRPSPAGLLALSGFIPTVPNFDLELEGRGGLPVSIAHGTHDPVIPVTFGREAQARLADAALDVVYRESAVGHTIDPRGLGDLRAWVARAIAGAPST